MRNVNNIKFDILEKYESNQLTYNYKVLNMHLPQSFFNTNLKQSIRLLMVLIKNMRIEF